MVELFVLVNGLAGDIHAELFEYAVVDLGENDGRMRVAVLEIGKRVHCAGGNWIGRGADGERDEHLVGMQARVVIAHVIDLQMLNRLDDAGGDELQFVRNIGKHLQRVQQRRG